MKKIILSFVIIFTLSSSAYALIQVKYLYDAYKFVKMAVNLFTKKQTRKPTASRVKNLLLRESIDFAREINFYKNNPNSLTAGEENKIYQASISLYNEAKNDKWEYSRCSRLSNHNAIVSNLFESIKHSDFSSALGCMTKLNTVNFHNQYGHTPLASAASHGHLDIARLVVRWGGDVDLTSRDSLNRTPLHLAVKNGHRAVAKFLYCKGASLHTRDSRGKTPLDYDRSQFYRNMTCA